MNAPAVRSVEPRQEPLDQSCRPHGADPEATQEPDHHEDRIGPQLDVQPVSRECPGQGRDQEYETDLGEQGEVATGRSGVVDWAT